MAGRSAFGREKNNIMLGTSRTQQQKAEARYNVTTQFPQYDLHFAAASGNLGLVEFALNHGQPINSVLNGVLPIHAACAGGSEVVVKYLIDEGADVNAPRIPRRYSNEKHKSSGLAVGASGSTPLHFAAANGHMGVVRLLLARGAVPDRADKHGVTPEMLARENGWIECADVLAAWSGGRSGDLPPVQPGEATGFGSTSLVENLIGNCGTTSSNGTGLGPGGLDNDKDREKDRVSGESTEPTQSGSKRLHMKRSIDNALHLFKAPLSLSHHGSSSQLRERDTPPSPSGPTHPHLHSFLHSHTHHPYSHSHGGSPPRSHLHSIFHHGHSHSTSRIQSLSQSQPQGQSIIGNGTTTGPTSGASSSFSAHPVEDYTFYPTLSASPTSPKPSVLDTYGIPGHRRPSLPQIFDEPASPFQRRLSGRRRRPRSAGSDAEEDTNGKTDGVNGAPSGGAIADGSTGSNSNINTYANMNTNTPSTRKLGSKLSLRNLFRRPGGETNTSLNLSGSEPGSGSASVSTSFSTSPAPIYQHAFSGRGSSSPTPPASPLSTSFAPSPMPGAGTKYRTRLGSESATPAPRSPLVPSAVELHHRYPQEQPREESQQEVVFGPEADVDAPVVAPKLSSRPSILRGHNRSTSSQSSGGTSGAGAKTLRFEASSANPNPSPGPNLSTASAIRLRGTRSASSLRHEQSYGYDEDDEDEEDYGTSIDAPESAAAGLLGYDDAELEEATGRNLAPPSKGDGYAYGTVGRNRGASFTSTGSSSPGISPEATTTPYEAKEFPFSIEHPPLTPLSTLSGSSVTTHYTLPEDVTETQDTEQNVKREESTESRVRGESFSSNDTDESGVSKNATESQNSSASALTGVTTPSPGVHPRTSPVLAGVENNADGQRRFNVNMKETADPVYMHESPSSSFEDLPSPEAEQAAARSMAPLDLRGISNLAEAEALVRRAQQAILASASLPEDGSESPGVPLAAQLAAYGEILALERRFARGEKQRELWAMRDDSDREGEDGDAGEKKVREPKASRIVQKRDVSMRQRGATTGTVGGSFRPKGIGKASKHKRPHTAEGAPQASWGIGRIGAPSASSVTGANTTIACSGSAPHHSRSHSRSTSTPLYLANESEKQPDISIIETTATPLDSPQTPEGSDRRFYPSTRCTVDDARPSLPMRSRTPDPEALASTDDLPLGVPLTRVATAPLQDTGSSSGSGTAGYGGRGNALRSDPATRRTGGAHKLAKMGFSIDAHHHGHHRHHHGNTNAYSPASSSSSSRSPSKARFGGIKSLVRGLKGKS